MQTHKPTRPRHSAPESLPLALSSQRDHIPLARRHFELEFECDGMPFRYHTSALCSVEAATRGRAAAEVFFVADGPASAVRLVACLERGPA